MTELINAELQNKIAQIRQRCLEGKVTLEEYREVIHLYRQGRVSAQATAAVKKRSAKAPPQSVDDMLKGL